jgi:hypothetical protein
MEGDWKDELIGCLRFVLSTKVVVLLGIERWTEAGTLARE